METNSNETPTQKVGRFEVGKAYLMKDPFGGHKYYLQRESDVLMVNIHAEIINRHEVDKLTQNEEMFGEVLEKISLNEFQDTIRQVIFSLGIYEFVKNM